MNKTKKIITFVLIAVFSLAIGVFASTSDLFNKIAGSTLTALEWNSAATAIGASVSQKQTGDIITATEWNMLASCLNNVNECAKTIYPNLSGGEYGSALYSNLQIQNRTRQISGNITFNRQPLGQVRVYLRGGQRTRTDDFSSSAMYTGAYEPTTTTDNNGDYSFSNNMANKEPDRDGEYLVIPVKPGFTFNPGVQKVTISSSNSSVAGINFQASTFLEEKPDLTVIELSSGTSVRENDDYPVRFKISNSGNKSSGSFVVKAYFSNYTGGYSSLNAPKIPSESKLLGATITVQDLKPGQTYEGSISGLVSGLITHTTYGIIILVDSENKVSESNEWNNWYGHSLTSL